MGSSELTWSLPVFSSFSLPGPAANLPEAGCFIPATEPVAKQLPWQTAFETLLPAS